MLILPLKMLTFMKSAFKPALFIALIVLAFSFITSCSPANSNPPIAGRTAGKKTKLLSMRQVAKASLFPRNLLSETVAKPILDKLNPSESDFYHTIF